MESPVTALSSLYGHVLSDVTAYVEVWSSNRRENYSKTFSQQLVNLGAKVSKTFNKHITHVVFKDGHQGTWDKAVKAGVKLVSVLWVERCREAAAHVDESEFPAINTNDGLPQIVKKKHKCMQPKDFVEKTPENDRRMQRKFDKMSKELKVQKAGVDDPVLLFDQYGTLMYSPKAVAADRCNAMEKRIKEMKNKRENLSPTASQISQTFDFPQLKPSLGYSPSALGSSPLDNGCDDLDTSYDELWGSLEKKRNISNYSKNKVTSKKSVIRATELEDPNCLLTSGKSSNNLTPQQIKDKLRRNSHAVTSFQKKSRKSLARSKTVEEPVQSFMNCGTQSALNSNVDYEALPNKLTVCKENESTKKVRSNCRKSKTPTSNLHLSTENIVMPEIPKLSELRNGSDSEGACSSFEDFFSADLKSQKRPFARFSLGTLPPESPTSPLFIKNKKGSSRKRRRSVQDLEECNCSGKRRRKSICSKDNLVNSEFKHDAKTMSPVADCVERNPIKTKINKTAKSDQVNNKGTTSSSLLSSETNLNTNDTLATSTELNQKKDIGLVKGMEKITELTTCKKSPNQPVMKNGAESEKQEDEPKSFQKYAKSKYPACDSLSKILNEQRNKCNDNEELKKKEKTRKISGSFVMTSMCSERQNTVIQVVKTFGGFVFSDHVCETTTHVIAGSPRRTLNIILGIARGCWIISYDWVLWSLECGHWISEEPYELSDHFPAAPICRLQRHLSAGEYQQDLLSSLPAVFISPGSQPPCDKLSEVVQLCGGKVCKAIRQAKVCIGEFNGKRAPDVLYVSEKWLLDSVTQHKLHPLENYLLNH
ncbi:hypothetical protein XENTR_v10014304 [Xenopus tropicalis]|uniref:Microcephalin isoform X1 n=1 Tax=Xenopus tropicalis TaxID=8364 RepID=A0A8J0T2P6_XENTR|nr:microcephalin isoform X1 [Xenopus tropicalis]KAE8603338.1 hypothetical protein XENTR_v10014304 [Xenopus tropicalis]